MSKKCNCGYDINHPKIIHRSEYSTWGWFLITILGLSAKPKKVNFECSECGDIISVATDPKVLDKFVGR